MSIRHRGVYCAAIHELAVEVTTIDIASRSGSTRYYVDPLQNDYEDMLAVRYSILLVIQTKINQQTDLHVFILDNILARIKKKGDLFAGVLDRKIPAANMKVLQKL